MWRDFHSSPSFGGRERPVASHFMRDQRNANFHRPALGGPSPPARVCASPERFRMPVESPPKVSVLRRVNRNEIESDPHALLDGVIIGAHVTGAT